MNGFPGIAAAALIALAPSAASAADWWWVAGQPGSDDVYFVDTDSIAADGAEKTFQLLHLSRAAPSGATQRSLVRCDAPAKDAAADDIRRFICATPAQRLSLGAMLGTISPQVTAAVIFQTPSGQPAPR